MNSNTTPTVAAAATEDGGPVTKVAADMGPWLYFPLDTDAGVSCGWGCYDGHTAHDFGGSTGEPVRAAADGELVVRCNGCGGSCGNYVIINHPNGMVTKYCHLDSLVGSARSVSAGDLIGHLGCTGLCTGPHLHFTVGNGSECYNHGSSCVHPGTPSSTQPSGMWIGSLARDADGSAPPPPPSQCGDLTFHGECDRGVLRWCEVGQVKSYDCAVKGRGCGWQSDSIGYNCVAGCGDLDYYGGCVGGSLRWCEGGAVRHFNCASSGRSCGWQSSNIGYNCL